MTRSLKHIVLSVILASIIFIAGLANHKPYIVGSVESTYVDGIYKVGSTWGFPFHVVDKIEMLEGGCDMGPPPGCKDPGTYIIWSGVLKNVVILLTLSASALSALNLILKRKNT